jgi:DUF1980 C-terminal domain
MVFIRAAALWTGAGTPSQIPSHDHRHEHPNCDHDHNHSWAPWRYAVLMLPVGLYSLGLIPSALSGHAPIDNSWDETGPTAAEKGGEIIHGFLELDRAAATEQSRKEYAGRTAQIIGEVEQTTIETRRFGLFRYKIGCCIADAVPLNLRVLVPEHTREGKMFDAPTRLGRPKTWVEVTGVIQFRKLHGSDKFVTVLVVPAQDVHVLPKPPANPYIY